MVSEDVFLYPRSQFQAAGAAVKVYQAQQKIEEWQKDRDKRVAEAAAAVSKVTDGTATTAGEPSKLPPSSSDGPEEPSASDKKDSDAAGKAGDDDEEDEGVPLTAEERAEK